jgi:hypothetical protein
MVFYGSDSNYDHVPYDPMDEIIQYEPVDVTT